MKVLRTIFIAVLAVLCGGFLLRFAQYEYSYYRASDSPGIYLLTDPHICVYRAFAHAHGESDGWTFFLSGDAPEGTVPVFYFPTWPFAVMSAGVLIYAAFSTFRWNSKQAC